jgi:DNA invertase Pin-like site-specific DNA recombinase
VADLVEPFPHAREVGPFDLVLVDDQSRLGRDLAKTLNTIFIDLHSAGVAMVDCTTGARSDTKVGRSVAGVTAIVNDQFLQMVRDETHRGLEGRALAGFHTAGREVLTARRRRAAWITVEPGPAR